MALRRLALVELKLMVRNPAWLFTFGIPLFSLLIFGLSTRHADPQANLDELTAVSLTTSLALVALYSVPVNLANYRDRGILRRFSTTPMSPALLLAVQLLLYLGLVVISTALLMLIARLALAVPLPRQAAGFLLAFGMGAAAMFTIGLVIAAFAPSVAAANGMGVLLFFPMAFLAGLMVPRALMPAGLVQLGRWTPLGAMQQSITGAWRGEPPQLAHLIVMVGCAAAAAWVSVRVFRWE